MHTRIIVHLIASFHHYTAHLDSLFWLQCILRIYHVGNLEKQLHLWKLAW